jgi:GNAT superfamily N-acetyltransferase
MRRLVLPDFTYREAHSDDAGLISALAARIWLETYAVDGVSHGFACYVNEALSVSKFEEIIASASHRALLCFCNEHLVAFAIVEFSRLIPDRQQLEVELDRLYVQKNFHRCGIGKALLGQSFNLALSNGFKALWLTVNAANDSAIQFYKSNGLQCIGDSYFELDGELHLNHVFILCREGVSELPR